MHIRGDIKQWLYITAEKAQFLPPEERSSMLS